MALCEELNSYYVAAKLSICDGPVAVARAAANSPKARATAVAEAEQKRVATTTPKQAAALTGSGGSSKVASAKIANTKVASAKVANSNGLRGQPAPKPRPASTPCVAAPVIAHSEGAAAVVAEARKKRKHTTGGDTEQRSSNECARVRNCPLVERSDPCAKKLKSLPSSAPVSAPAAVHADAACTDKKKKKKKNRKKKNLVGSV